MKPYYQDNSNTIYHGDSEKILPILEIADLVLTDPPYGIKEASNNNASRSKLAIAKDYGIANWDDERINKDLLYLAIGAGRNCILFGGNYYADLLNPTGAWLIWDKQNGGCDFADCEMAWSSFLGASRLIKYRWAGMFQGPSPKTKVTRYHPTQKPVPVMEWCIKQADTKWKKESRTILDPFMGSGTTLIAAKNLGRKSIGIEMEEKYCEIAAKRLSQGVLALGA